MKLREARALASKSSKDTCTAAHINVTIRRSAVLDVYFIDDEGYLVCDWFDLSTVETYINGERQ